MGYVQPHDKDNGCKKHNVNIFVDKLMKYDEEDYPICEEFEHQSNVLKRYIVVYLLKCLCLHYIVKIIL
jgi:hypothetical protein